MVWWKCSRRPFAMHPNGFLLPIDDMLFVLRNVVCDVIDQFEAKVMPIAAEHGFKNLACLPHQQLPVALGEIRGSPHRPQIPFTGRTIGRRANQLPVRKFTFLSGQCGVPQRRIAAIARSVNLYQTALDWLGYTDGVPQTTVTGLSNERWPHTEFVRSASNRPNLSIA
jgi:hypothetical protein